MTGISLANLLLALGAAVIWIGSFTWYFWTDLNRWLGHQYWWQQRRWLRRR